MRRRTFAAAALAALLTTAAPAAAQSLPQAGCDPLDPAVCLQPWPNDFFTRPDASTPTGKRLALPLLGMPRNVAGVPIRTDEYNRNDGFSPGSPIHTFVPGLDFGRTGLVPITDMARAFDAGTDKTLGPSCAKYFASEMVGRVADRAVQVHGGAGYMRGVPVERMFRDARLFRIYEGTSQIQQVIIARQLLGDAARA